MVRTSSTRHGDALRGLDEDDAFIALLIAAMEAGGHTSAEEAARAHHMIWSMRRFRHRSGDAVGRKIGRLRVMIERHGTPAVIDASAKKIPIRLRRAAFAIAADLVLVDSRMDRSEKRFLEGLAVNLRLRSDTARRILDVIRTKNSA